MKTNTSFVLISNVFELNLAQRGLFIIMSSKIYF